MAHKRDQCAKAPPRYAIAEGSGNSGAMSRHLLGNISRNVNVWAREVDPLWSKRQLATIHTSVDVECIAS